jgi:hypothetical protein
MQSLADIAREEAERRKQLEQQGIEGKVIETNAAHPAPNGNLTLSTIPLAAPTKAHSASRKSLPSVRSFRTALQKLDRTIRKEEARLKLLHARFQAGRWALPKVGRVSGSNSSTSGQERLQREIEDLQTKLTQLRQERFEIYESGKKEGFLPGELDGKGIIP